MQELGFAVAPGTHSLVGIDRTVTTQMEPPYGDCDASDNVPMSDCIIDCRTKIIVDKCGCKDIYMRNTTAGNLD